MDQSVADLVARRTKAYLALRYDPRASAARCMASHDRFATEGSASAQSLLAVHDLNAAAYDVNGSVYVNSEDGNLYVLNPHEKMEREDFPEWRHRRRLHTRLPGARWKNLRPKRRRPVRVRQVRITDGRT